MNAKVVRFLLLTLLLLLPTLALPQQTTEVLLSVTENAYNPIPSPDGKLIAYVRTGWSKAGVIGLGRGSLLSEISVMSSTGTVRTLDSLADAFLTGWTPDGSKLVCYRDGRFLLLGLDGAVAQRAAETGWGPKHFIFSERVAYLAKSATFLWVEHQQPRSQLLSQRGQIADNPTMTGNIVIPSPDERYIAVAGNGMTLWVYDRATNKWFNLGRADIHPDVDWDYIKPSWNPWFADSSRLVFFSGANLIVASSDGRQRTILLTSRNAGIPVPSPDGKRIAYVSFRPRPKEVRPDLKFWGDSTIWTVSADGNGKPEQVTSPSEDTTYDLKWAGNDRLVFDRIADEVFYAHARLWAVAAPKPTRQ